MLLPQYQCSPKQFGYPGRSPLAEFEFDSVTQRAHEPFPEGELDAKHFRASHHHLFQDVYSWAGEIRTIRVHRDGSTFCYSEFIEAELKKLFDWLDEANYLAGTNENEFATKGARFLSEMNVVHAFREGNGRAQMAFFALLAERAEHPLNFDRLDPTKFLSAMIAAFHGDEAPLASQIRGLL